MLTRYLWDYATNTCLAEMDEQGETLVDYTVDPQTGELISENRGGQEVYHRYDGDGNTRQTADSAGNVLGEATYSAFGETVAESGDMQTTYRFRGQRGFSTDSLTGDLSQGNQIYSPLLGRWLSAATLGGGQRNAYAANELVKAMIVHTAQSGYREGRVAEQVAAPQKRYEDRCTADVAYRYDVKKYRHANDGRSDQEKDAEILGDVRKSLKGYRYTRGIPETGHFNRFRDGSGSKPIGISGFAIGLDVQHSWNSFLCCCDFTGTRMKFVGVAVEATKDEGSRRKVWFGRDSRGRDVWEYDAEDSLDHELMHIVGVRFDLADIQDRIQEKVYRKPGFEAGAQPTCISFEEVPKQEVRSAGNQRRGMQEAGAGVSGKVHVSYGNALGARAWPVGTPP